MKISIGLPSPSATYYAVGYVKAGNGTIDQAAQQACVYDGVPCAWWRLVRRRVVKELASQTSHSLLTSPSEKG